MNELLDETKKYVTTGEMPSNKVFAHPLPLNVIPHIDVFQVRRGGRRQPLDVGVLFFRFVELCGAR